MSAPQAEPREGRHAVAQSPMRRAIARRMTESKQHVPHFYLSTEIEMDALLAAADLANEGRARDDRVTVTAFLLRAVALTLVERPVVRDGEIVVRRVMTATLSSDHRVVDGVGAAGFLGTLKGLVEQPGDWASVES